MVDTEDKSELERPPIKAVLFDLDGLLFDSERVWSQAYDIFLEKHNVVDNPSIHHKLTGRGLREIVGIMIDELGIQGSLFELLDDYRMTFYEIFLQEKDTVMQGGRELIEEAKKRGLTVGLTTGGHTEAMTRQILENAGLLSYFDLVVSSDDVKEGKPSPDVYLFSADKLSLKPGVCLVLEDSPNGVLAAKAAGMRVFGVNADEKIRADLEKAGVDKVYPSLAGVKL